MRKSGSMAEYVIAVARDKRSTAPVDWKLRVQRVKGVKVTQESPARLVIDAPPLIIEKVRRIVGSWCRIEPIIGHHVMR